MMCDGCDRYALARLAASGTSDNQLSSSFGHAMKAAPRCAGPDTGESMTILRRDAQPVGLTAHLMPVVMGRTGLPGQFYADWVKRPPLRMTGQYLS